MRNRKVISLYEADPSHAALLEYLDSIEGRNRQAQALLQMLLIGARVVIKQESGEEAWYAVRNPDVRTVRREAKSRQKPIPASSVPALGVPAAPREIAPLPVEPTHSPGSVLEIPVESALLKAPIVPYEPQAAPEPIATQFDQTFPDDDEDDDIMDPLQRLQMMKEE